MAMFITVLDNSTYDCTLQNFMKIAALIHPVFQKADCQMECHQVEQSVWCRGMPYISFTLECAEVEHGPKDWRIIDRCPF